MRLVLVASSLALVAAAHPAAHAKQAHAKQAHAAKPLTPVRAVIVSGDRQTARSYVAVGEAAYQAQFAKPLVVRIAGPGTPAGHPRHVEFTCERCVFAPTEQNQFDGGDDASQGSAHAKDENGKTIPSAYDAKPMNGLFGIYVLLQAPVVAGTYRVRVDPVPNKGERAVSTWFTLTTR
jgi:hypothetical protein